MARCSFIKGSGGRCKGTAISPDGYCWNHDPANAEQRRRQASRAGRAKPGGEVRTLKDAVHELIGKVEQDEVQIGKAGVMLQGYRVLKDLLELERKVREQDEVLARLEALERQKEREELWG